MIGLPAQYAYGLDVGHFPSERVYRLNRAFIPLQSGLRVGIGRRNLDRNSFPLYRNVLSSDVAKELFYAACRMACSRIQQ